MNGLTAEKRDRICNVCRSRGVRRLFLTSGEIGDPHSELLFGVEFFRNRSDDFSFFVVASELIEVFGARAILEESHGCQDIGPENHELYSEV